MTKVKPQQLTFLKHLLNRHPRTLILTGAGISVEAGIPSYRDREGNWVRNNPIIHQAFIQEPGSRKRYWARSFAGWPKMAAARPGPSHLALAAMQSRERAYAVITQNVDRLHQRAGSDNVIDLHGRMDRVVCLNCGERTARETMQSRLHAVNPGLYPADVAPAPDGDADVADSTVADFEVPACENCDGTLMPDVVFFGGSIPAERTDRCQHLVSECDALWVIGSSLEVFSGFRLCRQIASLDKPLVIINPGTTRADALASHKIESESGPLLQALAAEINTGIT